MRSVPAPPRSKRIPGILLCILVMVGLTPWIQAADEEPAFTLAGAALLLPDGTLKPGGALVVSGERIVRLAESKEEGLPRVIRVPKGAVISPGLIDLGSTIGAHGQNAEIALAVDPQARALDAVDPFHRDLSMARSAGITAALICPAPTSLVSGTSAVVRTTRRGEELDVLRREGPLTFALASSALRSDRAPTSRPGARYVLEETFRKDGGKSLHPRLKDFREGKTPGIVFCESPLDVQIAFDVFQRVLEQADRMPVLVYNPATPLPETRQFAVEAKEREVPVVVGPFAFTSSEARLSSAAEIARAGAPVAFRGGLPAVWRHSARVTAALAVRYGMDPAAARRSLTLEAARVAGVADRVGMLEEGKDADLVVFSGDPLRLDSRVLEVYVRGERVYPEEAERR